MGTLEGRIAVITGATVGIGQETAFELARRGAAVVIASRGRERGEAIATEIAATGARALFHQTDVSREADIERLIGAAVQHFGGIDILINNAALKDDAVFSRDRLQNLDAAVWDQVMAVNLRATALTSKYAVPEMLKRGGGVIVNTSSSVAFYGMGIVPAYSASKAGLVSLSQNIAIEYGKAGIRCNTVVPGMIMVPESNMKKLTPELVQVQFDNVLTPYLGEPSDIAKTIAFLVSDDARYITAQCIFVDGGMMAHNPTYAHLQKMKQQAQGS